MKKILLIILTLVITCSFLAACDSNYLIGTWQSRDEDFTITFAEDNICYNDEGEILRYYLNEDTLIVESTFYNETYSIRQEGRNTIVLDEEEYYDRVKD